MIFRILGRCAAWWGGPNITTIGAVYGIPALPRLRHFAYSACSYLQRAYLSLRKFIYVDGWEAEGIKKLKSCTQNPPTRGAGRSIHVRESRRRGGRWLGLAARLLDK